MSAVSDKKDACGFQAKATPRVCSTCANYEFTMGLQPWMIDANACEAARSEDRKQGRVYLVETHGVPKNLRCKTHGFAVKKMSACRDWAPAEETKT